MKKASIFVIILCLSLSLQAQNVKKVVVKSAIKGCWVALIKAEEAQSQEYGWWSVWHQVKKEKKYKTAPATFTNVPKGKYIVVIYDPASQKLNLGEGLPDGTSDGVVLQEVDIQGNQKIEVQKQDFKEWNCLSCPWLYVWNGKNFMKQTEVIKDIVGKKYQTTTNTTISACNVISKQVRIRIQEEKEETSFIDQIVLQIGTKIYYPLTENTLVEKLQSVDNQYIALKKGEMIELIFDLANDALTEQISLKTTGYYEPDQQFLSKIYQKYLRK